MKQSIQRLSALLLALALTLSLTLSVSAAETTSVLEATAEKAASAVMSYGQAAQVSWAVWQDGKIISSGSQRPEIDKIGRASCRERV